MCAQEALSGCYLQLAALLLSPGRARVPRAGLSATGPVPARPPHSSHVPGGKLCNLRLPARTSSAYRFAFPLAFRHLIHSELVRGVMRMRAGVKRTEHIQTAIIFSRLYSLVDRYGR